MRSNESINNSSENVNDEPKWSLVEDQQLLDELEKGETVKAYRAMQVIDGKLYPPMAAYVDGKLVESTELNTWYMADEHPELLLVKVGNEKYVPIEKYLKENNNVMPDDSKLFFKLGKGKDDSGKNGFIRARYNPYWHASLSPLNDQFKAAWNRSNMVIVEVEIPKSELTSEYTAKYAKDPVGETEWKSGSVSGQLAKLGKPRKVILSRYNKVVRIVPNSEIADRISEMLKGTGIKIPVNTVTPQLKAELEKRGIEFDKPEAGAPKQATQKPFYSGKLYSIENLLAEITTKAMKWGFYKLKEAAEFFAEYVKQQYEKVSKNYNEWKKAFDMFRFDKQPTEEQKKEIYDDIVKEYSTITDNDFDNYLNERAKTEPGVTKEQAETANELDKLPTKDKKAELGKRYLEQQRKINEEIEKLREPKPSTAKDKIEAVENWLALKFANHRHKLEQFQNEIKKIIKKDLPDWLNPHRQLDTIDGRMQRKIEAFNERYFKPLYDYIVKNKISYEDFNLFTYAMHANERNQYIWSINPNFKENNVRGSGWEDKIMGGTTDQVLNKLFAKYGKETLMKAGEMFWAMNDAVIDLQAKYNLIAPEVADTIKKKYKYYTPLKRIVDDGSRCF